MRAAAADFLQAAQIQRHPVGVVMQRLQQTQRALQAPDCPLESASLVYFDLETTGLHPERGATVTEAAVLDAGGLRFDWRRGDEVPDFAEVLPALLDHLAAGVVVGHNVGFDFGFLAYEAARRDARGPAVRYLDTLALARRLAPKRDNYRLGTLVDRYDLEVDGPLHTASVDVRATRALFWQLVDEAGLERLEDADLSKLDWRAL